MTRELRLDPDDAWHHVMNRGVDHMDIFLNHEDRRWFLKLLAEATQNAGVEVIAYCLVGNHYHLILHCPGGGLSACMKKLGGEYARVFNHHHQRDGSLWRGRFTSKIVESDEYLYYLMRYVHRNSLDIGISPAAWPWSSYGAYLGQRQPPRWLNVKKGLGIIGGSQAHREFVESVQPQDEHAYQAGRSADPEAVNRAWLESTSTTSLKTIASLVDQVACGLDDRVRQDIAMLVALDSKEFRPADLTEAFGAASPSTIRTRAHRARARLASNPDVTRAVKQVLQLLVA